MHAIILLFLCTTVLASKSLFYYLIHTHKYNEHPKIVGGTETTIEEYPFGVAMLFSRFQISYTQFCAGSIINNRSILSAGHCYHWWRYNFSASYSETNAANWRIRVGSTWANSGGVVFRTELKIVNPNYNRFILDNDIAIMRVSGTIVYGLSVAPASIAGTNYDVPDNESVWAIGWGRIYHGGPSSETLRKVDVWTINHELCKDRYATVGNEVTESMLCSGWLDVGGRDQCNGDSGGPLIHRGVVIGVCSWGNGCADPFFPGVNARVSLFTDSIVSNA